MFRNFFYKRGNAFFKFIKLNGQKKAQDDNADYRTNKQYQQHCGYPLLFGMIMTKYNTSGWREIELKLELPVDYFGDEPVEGYRIVLEFRAENQAGTGIFLRHERVVDATQVLFGLFFEVLQLEILAFDLDMPVVRIRERKYPALDVMIEGLGIEHFAECFLQRLRRDDEFGRNVYFTVDFHGV
jgi:hypothetical protein